MQRSNLDEFIRRCSKSEFGRGNEYVIEPGFKSLYVRYGARYICLEDRDMIHFNPVLDIASVSVYANRRGQGLFTDRISRLLKDYPDLHIYVENANPRFQTLLVRLGFKPHLPTQESFFLERQKEFL